MSDVQQQEVAGIDPVGIARWFGDLGIEATGRLSFARIGIGQSNLTYLVHDEEGRRWVLRRPPLGHLLASAHNVAREGRIMSALADTDVPAPRIFGIAEDPAISEVPLVLMEFVDGIVLDSREIVESLTPQRRRAIALSLPRTLAKIHAVDLNRVGLAELASHKPYAARQLKRWGGQWDQSKTRELPELDALTRRLVAAVPAQTELSLVHGDFHLNNVIISRGSAEVIAAVDWELSTLGDPLADMGSLLAYWPERGEEVGGGFEASTLDGFPDRGELTRIYLNETGRDARALQFWHILGLWKVAIIAEGVMRRAMDIPANKATAGTPTVEWIDARVQKAHQVADEAGL
ncbi:phosphotransferase family protein [Nocardia africana]|uniref:Phosphotransferase family protein n=1 Tax=Nocardia africana TaxID=134964 RepID=A0ABW6NVZ8_9NOCA